MNLALSILMIGLGVYGLCFAILAFPVMLDRNRLRKEAYDKMLDEMVHDLMNKMADVQMLKTHPPFSSPKKR